MSAELIPWLNVNQAQTYVVQLGGGWGETMQGYTEGGRTSIKCSSVGCLGSGGNIVRTYRGDKWFICDSVCLGVCVFYQFINATLWSNQYLFENPVCVLETTSIVCKPTQVI